jgi:hypothetical protein
MSMHFGDLAQRAAADAAISAEEIQSLRQAGWCDGWITPDEADAIVAAHDQITVKTKEWSEFFVEALCEFAVNGVSPSGYVDDAGAEWLIARLNRDGRIDNLDELELVVRILEKARNVPDRFKRFALEQIEQAVVTGKGPTRDGGAFDPGCINATESALLRRMIFATGGDRPGAVSLAEAEMLFRLKDVTLGAANAPEWQTLFVQGVANYLETYTSETAQLSRERAAELELFMNDTRSGVGSFVARMAKAKLSGFREIFARGTERDRDGEIAAAAEITAEEQAWLQARIEADGQEDELEAALLAFLGDKPA